LSVTVVQWRECRRLWSERRKLSAGEREKLLVSKMPAAYTESAAAASV